MHMRSGRHGTRHVTRSVFTLLAAAFTLGVALWTSTSDAGSCCRYVIRGCGKSAQVCVAGSCGSGTEPRARKAFEANNRCNSSSVQSSLGTCSNERCDIDLR